ncbi:MAG: T9SS type A sorting domain-containing protein [Paludibacter sp.]|nr:T9SS type A sorting domain-containing protein [Paludibacter sp.]
MSSQNSVQKSGNRVTVGLDITNVDGNIFDINPGDTICIVPGVRDHLRFANIHGDSIRRIFIVNDDGIVNINTVEHYFGIQFYNCSFFRITGTGDTAVDYGIKINETPVGTNGISFDGLSTDFEVDHVEISNTGFAGIFSLTQPDCEGKSTRDNFVMRNTSYHDNYIHDTYGEAYYIGHSYYTGYTMECNGRDTVVYPHVLKGVRIYNNLIERCGFDGIQISCADEDCEVYNNKLYNYGYRSVTFQNSGIQFGAGSTGRCYNNLLVNGSGNGINIFGLGNITVSNNIIVQPGYNFTDSVPNGSAYGIFCDDRATIAGESFYFINNTIIRPATDGIRIYSDESANNKIYNNLILKPGSIGKYNTIYNSYVYYNTNVDVDIRNNYFSYHLSPYIDYSDPEDIYDYTCTLDVFDKGIDVSDLGIYYDFNNNGRVLGSCTDIGAFEIEEQDNNSEARRMIKVYTNSDKSGFVIDNSFGDKINKIQVYSINGQLLFHDEDVNSTEPVLSYPLEMNLGVYIVCISTDFSDQAYKMLVR